MVSRAGMSEANREEERTNGGQTVFSEARSPLIFLRALLNESFTLQPMPIANSNKKIDTMMGHHRGTRRTASIAMLLASLLSISSYYSASASAIAPPLAARLATKRKTQKVGAGEPSAPTSELQNAATISQLESPPGVMTSAATATKAASSNPIVQLVTYVKDSMLNFKNGLGQMNLDHRRCNEIRSKQRTFATDNGFKRPRGVKGIQTGGISYEGENIFHTIFFMCLHHFLFVWLTSFLQIKINIIYRIRLLEEGLSRQKQIVRGISGHVMSSQLLRLLLMVFPGHASVSILKGKRYARNKQGEVPCGHFDIIGY